MTKNKKIGIILLLSPWIILVLILVLNMVIGIAINSATPQVSTDATVVSSGLQERPTWVVWAQLVRVFLGLIGMLNFFYIFVGTGLGIYFLVKREKQVTQSEISTK